MAASHDYEHGGRAEDIIAADMLRVLLSQIRTSHADPEICLAVERLRLDLEHINDQEPTI